MSTFQNPSEFNPVIRVSTAFVALYFVFLYLQSFSKFYLFFKARAKDPKANFAKIKYANTDLLAVTVDRTVGNMMEQAIPFLLSLWLCAVFESPVYAAKLGWYWLLFRAAYPIGYYSRSFWLFLSTLPCYAFIFMMLYPVASKAMN